MTTPAPTRRGREILELMAEGLSNTEIAEKLGLKTDTVKTHVRLLLQGLGATNRTHAIAIAYRKGFLPVDVNYVPPPPFPSEILEHFIACAHAAVAGHAQSRRIAADALNAWSRVNR